MLIIYYDNLCTHCRSFVSKLKRVDLQGRVHARPLFHEKEQDSRIDYTRAIKVLAGIDAQGRVSYGYETFCKIIKTVPLLRFLWPLFWMGKVTGLGKRAYEAWASRRKTQTCELP